MSPAGDGIRRALILPGGGARGAYQVGVLQAVNALLPRGARNPFGVIAGTSAGAINAAVLAARARRFEVATRELAEVWRNFRAHHVYRTDTGTMLRSSLRWLATLVAGGIGRHNPKSLLDYAPLQALLGREINFARIGEAIRRGDLDALAVTATAYGVGRSVTFFQGRPELAGWQRARRSGVPVELSLDHVLASAAVPMVFPPVWIQGQWYGDGAVRQAAPLSAAIHLGAQRLCVVGVRDERPDPEPAPEERPPYPGFGELAGYLLDSLFMDSLYADLERLTRINRMLAQLPPGLALQGPPSRLRRIDTLLFTPSHDVREIAQRHAGELPRSVRALLRGVGASNRGGAQLLSYLLFESGFTRELMALGYEDAMARRTELEAFLFASEMEELEAPEPLRRGLLEEA